MGAHVLSDEDVVADLVSPRDELGVVWGWSYRVTPALCGRAQALADATSDEVTIWRAGACSIWNELILSGPEVNWRRVADEYGDFASLTKDWFYFKKPADAASGAPWLAKTLGVDNDSA